MIRANSDLALARITKPSDALWEDLCFHAQQAAEKALKAVLVARAIEFPKSHDVRLLADLLRGAGLAMSPEVLEAATLTPYGTVTRYPGLHERVTEERYRKAVDLAAVVVAWAQEMIDGPTAS